MGLQAFLARSLDANNALVASVVVSQFANVAASAQVNMLYGVIGLVPVLLTLIALSLLNKAAYKAAASQQSGIDDGIEQIEEMLSDEDNEQYSDSLFNHLEEQLRDSEES